MAATAIEQLARRIFATIGIAATVRRNCAACDRPADSSRLCASCRSASGFGDGWRLRRVVDGAAKALPVYAFGLYRDGDERTSTPAASLLRRFKYGGDRATGRVLAQVLRLAPRLPVPAGAVFVPVPLHPRRLRQRGFNQAAWLARPLARRNGCPLCPDALHCALDTPSHAQMTRVQRQSASVQLFRVGARPAQPVVAVIVDDVCTTGATLCAARATLEAAGFHVPFAAVLLSTERSDDGVADDASARDA